MQSPPARRFRRLRIIGLIGLGLILMSGLVWLMAGHHIVAAVINRYLPYDSGEGLVVSSCRAGVPADEREVDLRMSAARAHALSGALLERPLPTWCLRAPMYLDATSNDPDYGPMPLRLRLERNAEPPLLTMRLRSDGLNAMLKRNATQLVEVVQGMSIAYTAVLAPGSTFIDDGAITHTEEGPERRFRFRMSGAVDLTINGEHGVIPVRDLRGTVTVLFARGYEGFRPRIHVAVDALDAELKPPAPGAPKTMLGFVNGLGSDQLKSILETALNTGFSDPAAQELVLPPWFPVDLRVDAATR